MRRALLSWHEVTCTEKSVDKQDSQRLGDDVRRRPTGGGCFSPCMPLDPLRACITTGPVGEECTIYPARTMGVGTLVETDSGFTVRRFTSHYSCSCPAWRCNTSKNVRYRTCEHLADVLGEEYERIRTNCESPVEPHTPTKRTSASEGRRAWDSYLSPSSSKRSRTSPTSVSPGSPSSLRHISFLLASTWPSEPGLHSSSKLPSSRKDPTGWWISEKFDGVRAWWDGETLWSRRGQVWNAPSWFTDALPSHMSLDGELWIDRGLFEHTSGVCRASNSDDWHRVKYMVFDAPDCSIEPVEDRWGRIKALFPIARFGEPFMPDTHHVYMVDQVPCRGPSHLEALVDQVLSAGGEGVMLRAPHSVYERRRSSTLYKWKPFLDGEARVIGYEQGQKSAAGLVGSLVCETYSDEQQRDSPKRFRVGSGLTQFLRQHPPPIGTIIRYHYGGLSSQGIPRFPQYAGIRHDM